MRPVSSKGKEEDCFLDVGVGRRVKKGGVWVVGGKEVAANDTSPIK
jgi:hypothetical protein